MLWIVTTVLLVGAAIALAKANLKPFALGTVGLWALVTLLCSVNQIEAGKIGLVRTFGEFTGQQSPGLNFKAPFQSVTEVDGRILKHRIEMSGGDKGSAVSKETQPVYAKLEINYQLQLDKARSLYSEVGESYYSRIIEPRVQQAFKAETVKYKTIDIAPQREQIREDVRAALDDALDEYGIDVTALTIRDLDFGQKFMDAIEDKQAATEQAKAAAEKVAIAKANADSAREQARGEADAIAIKGRALAENPQSVELAAIEKLNPNVEVMIVPANSPILQLPNRTR